jgi:hypothetical protein
MSQERPNEHHQPPYYYLVTAGETDKFAQTFSSDDAVAAGALAIGRLAV